jgi:hypothetical protein
MQASRANQHSEIVQFSVRVLLTQRGCAHNWAMETDA